MPKEYGYTPVIPPSPFSADGLVEWSRVISVAIQNMGFQLGQRIEDVLDYGTFDQRPDPDGVPAVYYATDTGKFYFDTGTWVLINEDFSIPTITYGSMSGIADSTSTDIITITPTSAAAFSGSLDIDAICTNGTAFESIRRQISWAASYNSSTWALDTSLYSFTYASPTGFPDITISLTTSGAILTFDVNIVSSLTSPTDTHQISYIFTTNANTGIVAFL